MSNSSTAISAELVLANTRLGKVGSWTEGDRARQVYRNFVMEEKTRWKRWNDMISNTALNWNAIEIIVAAKQDVKRGSRRSAH